MPRVQAALQETFGRSPSFSMPPEEVIALGAALRGRPWCMSRSRPCRYHRRKKRRCSARWAWSWRGVMLHARRRCDPPCEKRYVFSTTRDSQTGLRFMVVEGATASAAKTSCSVSWSSTVRAAPRGEADIEVHFQLSDSGTLTATATNLDTKDSKKLQCTNSALLGPSSSLAR